LYGRSAEYYDIIYSYKKYKEESAKLRTLIRRYKRSSGRDLLDVACGTGGHIAHLKQPFKVEGLDINPRMLRIARKKHPSIVFHRGDMTTFKLSKKFDVIVCLFSAVGHLKTKQKLVKAIQNMTRHLRPGGVLIVEPWITPEQWLGRSVHAVFVNQPKLKIARMNISKRKGRLSLLDEHHMVATPKRVEHFVEHLELRMYTADEYFGAFRKAKLETHFDPKGLIGRGLYIGVSQSK